MRLTKRILVLVVSASIAAPALGQANQGNPPETIPDPRDRIDPVVKGYNPNRLDPRVSKGSKRNGQAIGSGHDDDTPDATVPGFAAAPEPVPGSGAQLDSMGDMAMYVPPGTGDDGSPTPLPGMQLYVPPTSGQSASGYSAYPNWWPQ